MAAQYTEISLDEMEIFLKRAFRALRPKQGVQRGEYYYDLKLSDHVVIRVWTSVQRGTQSGAGVGQDAIRVQLMGVQVDRPLMKGKAPIVKRTQGWKNTLQNKIEEFLETYEDKSDYWDSRGSGGSARQEEEPQEERVLQEKVPDTRDPDEKELIQDVRHPSGVVPITEKQLKYLSFLMRGPKGRSSEVGGLLYTFGVEPPYNAASLSSLTKSQASRLISMLAEGHRYAEFDEDPTYSYDFRSVN